MGAAKNAYEAGSSGVATRDEEFAGLFEQRYRAMVRLAFALVSSADEAEEIVQDALVEIYGRWFDLQNPAAYLRTMVINGSRRALRRRLRREEIYRQLRPADDSLAGDDYVIDALKRLPERERVAVVLAYYGHLTSREIAETMLCPEGSAKSLVHRGIQRLRKELDHE